jgi:outer membrane protein
MRKGILRNLCLVLACVLVGAAQTAPPKARPLDLSDSPRIHELIRAGNLYLSLQDALALAIENSLDIEVQRYGLDVATADLLRTQGGGTARGLSYAIFEAPAGVGGPLSPVVTNAASGRATNGTAVGTNPLELGVLSEPQQNLSVQGTIPQSGGTPTPVYDTSLIGQVNWTHQSTPQTNLTGGVNALVTNTANLNTGLQRGFASGAQVGLNFNNSHQTLNLPISAYSLYNGSSLGLTITQPLLRGFGRQLNRRFIRIAQNQQRIGTLLFQQQLITTVYGVIRLYTDFVALYEDARVKQDTLALAEKLLADTQAQVEEGTLAQVEATRARAQVFSARQDWINARGLLEEQEAILKNVLTRRGSEDSAVREAHLIPTDTLQMPEKEEEVRPIQDLFREAMERRPDLLQAQLQVENLQIGLEGSRNLTRPQVDLVGALQNNGLAGVPNPLAPNAGIAVSGGYGGALEQVLSRKYPTYGVGIQVTLPIHNRIAEADLIRDELQVKQSQIRLRQLQNQARLELEDALIAMRRARASYEAAVQARKLQEESLAAEQAKFEVGASTSFFVIQYESLLSQAKSTEVAAKSSYMKARAALARATGSILEENQISLDAAIKGR